MSKWALQTEFVDENEAHAIKRQSFSNEDFYKNPVERAVSHHPLLSKLTPFHGFG